MPDITIAPDWQATRISHHQIRPRTRHVDGALEASLNDAFSLNSILKSSNASFIASETAQMNLVKLSSWYAERLAFTEQSGANPGSVPGDTQSAVGGAKSP